MDLHNFLEKLAPWIVIAVCITVNSTTLIRADINVFAFFAGMVSSYYLYINFIAGFFPKSYALVWMAFTEIIVKTSMSAATVQKILDAAITWKIDCDGAITSSIKVVKDDEFPDLPRFGLRLFLNKKLENVSYFGLGPHESYRDKHQSTNHGLYRAKVSEMHEDYIMPQENSSHFDCDYVEIANCQFGIAAASEKTFSFNASVYTQEELERAAHNYELEESESTVLCLDYALNGIGSNSCGPVLTDQYRFDDVAFDFNIKLVPFVKG